ncbi:MAG: TolC family protein [Bacteroidota bacterium]
MLNSIKKRFLSILPILFINIASAQQFETPKVLKLLVDQSFQKYPRVAELNEMIKLNVVRVSLGKTAYLPVLNGDLSYRMMYPTPAITFPDGSGGTKEIHFQPIDNYNAGINLAQPIVDLRVPAMLNKAKSELETTQDNLEGYKIKLAYQVAQLYYAIIFLNKSIFVQEDQIRLLRTTLDQIGVRVKNGDALNYDLVSTQVKYTNAENFHTELQAQLDKQYNVLGMLTGVSGNTYLNDTTFNAYVFSISTDSVVAQAYRNNPELIIANDRIKTAGWDILTAERSRMPVLNLQAGLGYKNGYMPDINTIAFNYYVGLGLTIPILPASRPYYQKKMAVINQNTFKLALETQKVNLNKDLLNAINDIHKNQKKLASADTLIKQAQLAMDLATDRYKYGVMTNLDLLTAMTNYKDAQLSQLQFEYNLLLSRMDLCQLAGLRWW